MSQLNVDNIQNRTGSNGGPNFPSGISVAVGQTAYIHGNLQVDGTETIINTETLNVADKTVGIGSTSNASNTTADGSGIEVFASSSQTGNNKTLTWGNTANSWEFGPNDVGLKVGTGVTVYGGTGIVSATSFKGDGSLLTGIDATSLKDGSGNVKIQANSDGAEVTGILTATSFKGSGANLTNLPPGGNVISGIASGAIASDKCVALAQDGKLIQVIAPVGALNPLQNIGGQISYYNAAISGHNEGVYIPTVDRTINFFRAGSLIRWRLSNCTTGATVSDDYITNSDPGSGVGKSAGACFDPDNSRVFVAWSDTTNGDRGYCCVGTVSASNISWGTPVVFETSRVDYIDATYDTTQNRVVVVYQKVENQAYAIVGTIANTGNSVTFGTAVDVNSGGAARNLHCVHDVSANKILITYENSANSQRAGGRLATVANTGNTITMVGSVTELNQATGMDCYSDLAYDSVNEKSLFVYKGASHKGYGRVLSISGTTISLGTEVVFYDYSLQTSVPDLKYDTGINKFLLAYIRPSHSAVGGLVTATISGTSVSFGTEYNVANIGCHSPVIVSNNSTAYRAVFSYALNSNDYLKGQSVKTGSPTPNIASADQYVGFADTSYTNGQTVTVKTVGNTTGNLSGLTTGTQYYVQGDGTINTSWDSVNFASFATNTPVAGRAISSTTLQIFQPR